MPQIDLNRVLAGLRPRSHTKLTAEEERITQEFLAAFPDAGEKLRKYQRLPTCGSCRRDLLELITEDTVSLGRFLSKVPELPEVEGRSIPPYSAAGKCVTLPDTEEAYTEFIKSIAVTGGKYHGVQVRDLGEGQVRVYVY